MGHVRRVPWWAWVFLLGFGMRLGFVVAVDEPLLFGHQYQYFTGALTIVEHPEPWEFVLTSDLWHAWSGIWTTGPLYHLFLAGLFFLFGPQLLPVQVVQCALGALTAVFVGSIGRCVAAPRGIWAGVAYALYWPSIETPSRTMTENLHTVLLVGAVAVLLAGVPEASEVSSGRRRPRWLSAAAAGLMLGLSALVRSVSAAFVLVAAAWGARRNGRRAGALVLFASALTILPWTMRNGLIVRDWVLIDTLAAYNFWTDNAFVNEEKYWVQEAMILKEKEPQARRARAFLYGWRGLTERPAMLPAKVWHSFWHFLRPEGLHQLLRFEYPYPGWRHAAAVLLDDGVLIASVPLLLLYLAAGPRSPARSLIGLWVAYYLLVVVVVFHNEIRYRSAFVPFALAGAVGGVAILADRERRTAWRARGGLLVGGLVALGMMRPYFAEARNAVRAEPALRSMEASLLRGDRREAESLAFIAASEDKGAARPWLRYGRALAWAGDFEEAAVAYRKGFDRRPHNWVPRLVLPRLLREAGRTEEADEALQAANRWSWDVDPWLALEIAWREVPPPRGQQVLLARGDYGAVRGFLHPRAYFRWSRHRAWIRVVPIVDAEAYEVTLEMASPEPSPRPDPVVTVWVEGGARARFSLTRNFASYTLRTPVPQDRGVLLVRLEAPTWNSAQESAEQGVAVSRMTIAPAR